MTASLWALDVVESVPGIYLADEKLLAAIITEGLSPATARKAIAEALGDGPVTLELIRSDYKIFHEKIESVGDILVFNWMPVFSEAAYDLLISEGCAESEFIDCRFRALGDRQFKIHVPLVQYDVIDFQNSIAKFSIPLEPPIPFHFMSVKLKPDRPALPPCFRVSAPGQPQVLSELFALDSLRAAWECAGPQRAFFRPLTSHQIAAAGSPALS